MFTSVGQISYNLYHTFSLNYEPRYSVNINLKNDIIFPLYNVGVFVLKYKAKGEAVQVDYTRYFKGCFDNSCL